MASRNTLPPHRDGLPPHYRPISAGYARGPLITEPEDVRASAWSWRGNRTYVVRHEGHDYRAVRLYDYLASEGEDFLGYWAVELLGVPLDLGSDYE